MHSVIDLLYYTMSAGDCKAIREQFFLRKPTKNVRKIRTFSHVGGIHSSLTLIPSAIFRWFIFHALIIIMTADITSTVTAAAR